MHKHLIPYLFVTLINVGTILFLPGCKNSAIKVTHCDGHDIISCNIDKIKETRNLMMSEIAEYSEIVVLSNDSSLKDEDYNIQRIVVSDKYIVVMPRSRAALLYNRNGEFIKRLATSNNSKDEQLCTIHAQIDDERDMIYLLVCGLELLRFNAHDAKIMNIFKAVKNSMDFVLLDDDKILVTFPNNQNIWGYTQSIHATKADYFLHSRIENNLLNHMSKTGKILKWGDKIVLSFLSANDTSYYYTMKNKTFVPFLRCFSPKNSIKIKEQIENSPELLDLAAAEILKDKKLYKKRLLFINERHCLFRLFDGSRKYYVIDKQSQQAYFLDKIINDFWGNLDMNYNNMFDGWHYVTNKDGYLTFNYRISQFREEVKKLKTGTQNETLKNKLIELRNKTENNPYNILLINKLKK